jgi:PTS system cellobiose-specific IIC component
MGNLSASGLFLGMMSTVFAVEIIRWVLARGWKLTMPDSWRKAAPINKLKWREN